MQLKPLYSTRNGLCLQSHPSAKHMVLFVTRKQESEMADKEVICFLLNDFTTGNNQHFSGN